MLAITRPGILPSLVVTFLYLTGGFIIICYMAALAAGAGLPVAVLPGMLLAFGIGAVAGNYASGQLADRLGATRVVVLSLLLSSAICVTLTLILQLPSAYAGPLLIGIMVPWGFIGWTFPPAQASRIVAHAPDLANLTLPLNASAMYFGIALGSAIGGQVLQVAPASELGVVAAGFPLVALAILFANSRRRVSLPAE
jgi:predicted MFS family arabinose efflux permease